MDVKFLKALIKTDLIDFTLYDKGLTIEFHGGEIAEKEYSLQTLRQTYHILSLFREGECLVTFKMHKSGREINLPLRLDNDGDLSWIDPLAKLICAADELRQLAGMEDYPVGVGSLIAEQFEIFKVHALFATGANADSIQFATESTKLSVEETPFIFISGVNIGKRVLAYALRGTIAPRNADNLIQWKSKKLEPLVIEQLSGDVNGQYRAFTEKIARVSGISTILQSTLTTNEKG